jgi:IS5 family transposase
MQQAALEGLRREIDTMVPRIQQVIRQTKVRIFKGDTHADGKLFSIFEPGTEIIRKGKAGKPNEFRQDGKATGRRKPGGHRLRGL